MISDNNVVVVDFEKKNKQIEEDAVNVILQMLCRLYLDVEKDHGNTGNVA